MAVTLSTLKTMRERGEKIAVLTCYDASFARVLDAAGVDVLLVGDSLGMVVQGHASTLPVKLADMIYHTRCVAAGTERAFIVADLPFGSYQPSPERAFAASRAADGGGRAHGQAGRRRGDGRDGGLPHPARHPGVRASRPAAAVGATSSAATRCRGARMPPPRN